MPQGKGLAPFYALDKKKISTSGKMTQIAA